MEKSRKFFCPESDSRYTTFIAIDFGTTFSGFACAIGRNSQDIYSQPQAQNSLKEPTAVLLRPDGQFVAFGTKAREIYFDLEDEVQQRDLLFFDRFKMTLKDETQVSSRQRLKAANGKELLAKTVFARSLQYFYETARKVIPRKTGATWVDGEVKWILTVPAIWGDRAKRFMQEAAQEAGMTSSKGENVEVALEPEAAALTCRSSLSNLWQNLGNPEKLRYIVVDCGGGTVDCTVQEVDMATSKINEIHPASGGPWGATEVDKKVLEVIHSAIGVDVAKKVPTSCWLQFERLKVEEGKKVISTGNDSKAVFDLTPELYQAIQEAGGNLTKSGPLKVDGAEFRQKRNSIMFNQELIAQCYKEAVGKIVDHVRSLLHKVDGVNCILVVGGFAESPLLMEAIEKAFNPSPCRIIHPDKASMAVVKGAVKYGQNPDIVQSRVMKFTYGIETFVPFVPGEHPQEKRFTDGGQDYCSKIFAPFVKAGESININCQYTKEVRPSSATQKAMRLQVYRSPRPDVQFTDELKCERLLALRLDMPRTEFGQDRVVDVMMDFSRTTLRLHAEDRSSGICGDTVYNELS